MPSRVSAASLLLLLAFAASAGEINIERTGGGSGSTPETICVPPCADNESLIWDDALQCFDCVPATWLDGTFGLYYSTKAVEVGTDVAPLSTAGGSGVLLVQKDIELGSRSGAAAAPALWFNRSGTPWGSITVEGGGGLALRADADGDTLRDAGTDTTLVLSGGVAPANQQTSYPEYVFANDGIYFGRNLTVLRFEGTAEDGSEFHLNIPNVGADRDVTMPSGAPSAGYAVTTDASGVWSYTAPNSLINPVTFSCESGEPAPNGAPTNTGGLLCITGVANGVGIGDDLHVISDPLSQAADNDGASAVDDEAGTFWWTLGCEGGSADGGDDNISACVINVIAAEGGTYGTTGTGPALQLTGGDAEGEAGIGTHMGNSAVIANNDLGGNSTISSGNRGGGIFFQNRHKYGAATFGSTADENLNGSGFMGLCVDRDWTDGTPCATGFTGSVTIGGETFVSMIGIIDRDTQIGPSWGSGPGTGEDAPLYLASVTDGAPQIIVEGQPNAHETGIYFDDATADRSIHVPDASGEVVLTGRQTHGFPLYLGPERTFLNLGAADTEFTATGGTEKTTRTMYNNSGYNEVRLVVNMGTPATDGVLTLQCDTLGVDFASATDEVSINPTDAGVNVSAWTTLGAGCVDDDLELRVIWSDGNTTEDPSVISITAQYR